MPTIVTDYRKRKLVEYDFKRGLLVFWHGLGDLVMFLPVWDALRVQYDLTLGLQPGVGQQDLVDGIELTKPLHEYEEYDHVFVVAFPMSEGGNTKTKLDKCLEDEIGPVSYNREWRLYPGAQSRIVGVNFQGTCLPESTNPPEQVCRHVWDEVVEAGYVPLEVMFHHRFHNPRNVQYPFVTATTRHAEASVQNLIGTIVACHAFIGVASGPWVLARQILTADRVLFLEVRHMLESYTHEPCAKIYGTDYQAGAVRDWLNRGKE